MFSKEVFDKVQEGRGKKRPPQYHGTHPLVGKLVCGCCKKNLHYRRGLNPYFTCSHRYSNNMKTCVRRVNAMFAEQYVLLMMQDKLEAEEELAGINDRLEKAAAEYFAMGHGGEMYPQERFAELSKEMIERYIEKIEVYDEQHMEIRWKND